MVKPGPWPVSAFPNTSSIVPLDTICRSGVGSTLIALNQRHSLVWCLLCIAVADATHDSSVSRALTAAFTMIFTHLSSQRVKYAPVTIIRRSINVKTTEGRLKFPVGSITYTYSHSPETLHPTPTPKLLSIPSNVCKILFKTPPSVLVEAPRVA